ncbi:MAG: hypothetical protein ACLPX9_04625 [Rhodomicrobium sp.]
MLKRLAISLAAICLLAVAPAQRFQARAQTQTPLQEAIAKLTPEQQARLKAYEAARIAFQRRTDQYWRLIGLKRKKRQAKFAAGQAVATADYVADLPPVYGGPPRPADVMAQLPKPPPAPAKVHEPVPVVTDFLQQAQEVYGFKPDRVNEDDFMISYAMEAIRLGLSRDQVVRLYALETGGIGTHDLQSGYNRKTNRAASTALGYAQMLAASTIEQLRKEGEEFAARLERQAADGSVPESKAQSLRAKAAILRRMIADAKKVPGNWPAHAAYARTPKGIAMHALNLDGDVGPWMQVVKLKVLKEYAAKKGMTELTGAQLELMNLAGASQGFEMMQPIGRTMPTSNFFERRQYERNPVAAGKKAAQLLAKLDEIMDHNVQRQGAQRFASIFDSIAHRLGGPREQSSADAWQPLTVGR